MKKKYGDKIREAIHQQELNPVHRSIFTNEIQNILYDAIDEAMEIMPMVGFDRVILDQNEHDD